MFNLNLWYKYTYRCGLVTSLRKGYTQVTTKPVRSGLYSSITAITVLGLQSIPTIMTLMWAHWFIKKYRAPGKKSYYQLLSSLICTIVCLLKNKLILLQGEILNGRNTPLNTSDPDPQPDDFAEQTEPIDLSCVKETNSGPSKTPIKQVPMNPFWDTRVTL